MINPSSDITAELYMLLGKLDGKVDGLISSFAAVSSRTDRVEQRVSDLESRVDTISAERGQNLPEFKSLLGRVDGIEGWQREVQTTAKVSAVVVKVLWAVAGTAILGLAGWLISHYLAK